MIVRVEQHENVPDLFTVQLDPQEYKVLERWAKLYCDGELDASIMMIITNELRRFIEDNGNLELYPDTIPK